MALVVKPGVVVSLTLATNQNPFAWFEGAFDNQHALGTLAFIMDDFTVLDHLRLDNFGSAPLEISGNNVQLRHLIATNAGTGLALNGHFNVLRDAIITNSAANGININATGTGDLLLDAVRVSDSAASGLVLGDDTASSGADVVIGSVFAANHTMGVWDFSDDLTLLGSSIIANGNCGVLFEKGSYPTTLARPKAFSLALINNHCQGLFFGATVGASLIGNVAAANDTDTTHDCSLPETDYYFLDSASSFQGAPLLSDQGAAGCSSQGPNSQELTICSAAPVITMTAGSASQYFLPAVQNAAVSDWASASGADPRVAFTDAFEFWGSALPATDLAHVTTGACTGGTCDLWDASLSATATDNDLRNSAPPLATDASAVFQHHWDVTGFAGSEAAICETLGGTYNATGPTCVTTALLFASEISGDGIGNDNGLCESGETCLRLQNAGAYQGSGAQTQTPYNGSSISNVTLLTFEDDGEP